MPEETSKQRPLRVVEMVHRWVEEVLGEGEIAIDATAGNGHDTAFLAQLVGSKGEVHAFDVQELALQKTRERIALLADSTVAPCHLHLCGHEDMQQALPTTIAGKVGAMLFNFGYLPGGDHQLITSTETSLRALSIALSLLRPGGIVCAVTYPDHAGGQEEALAVERFFRSLIDPQSERSFEHKRYPTAEDYRRGPIALALTSTKSPAHQEEYDGRG